MNNYWLPNDSLATHFATSRRYVFFAHKNILPVNVTCHRILSPSCGISSHCGPQFATEDETHLSNCRQVSEPLHSSTDIKRLLHSPQIIWRRKRMLAEDIAASRTINNLRNVNSSAHMPECMQTLCTIALSRMRAIIHIQEAFQIDSSRCKMLLEIG
jgi:hypothetical protein